MKFIISEHRLDKLIYSFIDEHVKDMFNRELIDSFIVYSQNTENEFEDKSVKIEYDYFDGRLYIDGSFIRLISDMFSIDDGMPIVKRWLISKLGDDKPINEITVTPYKLFVPSFIFTYLENK